MSTVQTLTLPPIELRWSEWTAWSRLQLDARSDPQAVRVPDKPGVYEAKLVDSEERLTIGRASNLRMRIKQGLVKKDKVPHSSGDNIRTEEDTSRIVVRWALTDWPAAAEEELHKQYKESFGALPKHTKRT